MRISHSSRTAPRPPGRERIRSAACSTGAAASATATAQATSRKHGRPVTSWGGRMVGALLGAEPYGRQAVAWPSDVQVAERVEQQGPAGGTANRAGGDRR